MKKTMYEVRCSYGSQYREGPLKAFKHGQFKTKAQAERRVRSLRGGKTEFASECTRLRIATVKV